MKLTKTVVKQKTNNTTQVIQNTVVKQSDPILANQYRVMVYGAVDLLRYATYGLKDLAECSLDEKHTVKSILAFNEKKVKEIKDYRLKKRAATKKDIVEHDLRTEKTSDFILDIIAMATTVPDIEDARTRILDKFDKILAQEKERAIKNYNLKKDLKK